MTKVRVYSLKDRNRARQGRNFLEVLKHKCGAYIYIHIFIYTCMFTCIAASAASFCACVSLFRLRGDESISHH